MRKYVLLIGIPASGKSTYTEKNMPSEFIRLNADGIREAMCPNHNELWYSHPSFKEREGMVHELLRNIEGSFQYIWNDNTNLNLFFLKKDIERILTNFDSLKIIVLKDSENLDLCIQRDANRGRTVGAEKLKYFHQKYLEVVEYLESLKDEKIEVTYE